MSRERLLAGFLNQKKSRADATEAASVRILVQMLQVESQPVRLWLVRMLADTKGESAGAALAQRAVFDLSPAVREAAVKALKHRPSAEYRPALLVAFRYPWVRAADHAAEALVALEDREAVFSLVNLLDEPDPRAPSQDKEQKWVVSELVRVNHLGNCLLCHAPSAAKDDPVRAMVPERGKPLSVGYSNRGSGDFVRADVTYLKQDFSAIHAVTDHGHWPVKQRFDFLVRKRELSADEATRLTEKISGEKPTAYPQRDAVRWALRELTGRDSGDRSEDWLQDLLEDGLLQAQ